MNWQEREIKMALLGIEELLFNNGPRTTALGIINDEAELFKRAELENKNAADIAVIMNSSDKERQKALELLQQGFIQQTQEKAIDMAGAAQAAEQPTSSYQAAPVEEIRSLENPPSESPELDLTPQQKRVKALNKTFSDPEESFYAGKNIVATLQPNGVIEFSNIKPPANNSTNPNFKPPQSESTEELSINKMHEEFNKLTTSDDTLSSNNQFRTNLNQVRAQLTSKAYTTADNSLGIPRIQQEIEMSRRQDSLSGQWPPMDSPNTQALTSKLATLMIKREEVAKQILQQNTEFASLTSLETNFESLVQRQTKLADKRDSVEGQKEIQQAVNDANLIAKYGQGVIKRARVLMPDSAESSDAEVARRIDSKFLSDDAVEALQANGDDLIGLAVKGNKDARNIAISEEAAIRGQSVGQVSERFKEIESTMNNPTQLKSYINNLYGTGTEQAKQAEQAIKFAAMPGAKKEDIEKASNLKLEIGLASYRQNAIEKFQGRVDQWSISNPELADIAKQLGTNASLPAVARAYVGASTGAERNQKIAILKAEILANGSLEAKSRITQLPVDGIAGNVERMLLPEELGGGDEGWMRYTQQLAALPFVLSQLVGQAIIKPIADNVTSRLGGSLTQNASEENQSVIRTSQSTTGVRG